jgi:hypothetical protein
MWRTWALMALAVLAALASWAGLWYLIHNTSPEPFFPLFLALTFTAVSFTSLPVVAYLNRRFSDPATYRADYKRLLRQSGWLGLFAALCAWLQPPPIRVLNGLVAAILFSVFALVEAFLLTRQQ